MKKAKEWYNELPDDIRIKIQDDFGNNNIPNREIKLYSWIQALSKSERESYINQLTEPNSHVERNSKR